MSGYREVDQRASGDGLEVTLLLAADGLLAVRVIDVRAGEAEWITNLQPERALHAYRHPMLYTHATPLQPEELAHIRNGGTPPT